MAIGNIILGAALRGTLLSINRTQDTIDTVTGRLASGLKVNSAIDQPQNFFTARFLRNEASDQSRLLDGIGQSIRTVQEAVHGTEALSHLIDQADAVVQTSYDYLQAGDVDPAVYEKTVNTSPQSLNQQILSGAPDVYYALDETGGPIVDYGTGAGVNATYFGGAAANGPSLYTNGSQPSVDFDGINDRINVADSNLINLSTYTNRTVELVFNADDIISRQVLYEEGAGVNGFTIYIDNGLVRVTGEDDQGGQRWADADISAPIVAGQTYHVAFVYDGPNTQFTGYLDGVEIGTVDTNGATTFPSHSGNIGIGGASDAVQWHDGESGGGGFAFDGRISNVAIYNRALAQSELDSHANALNATTSLVYLNQEYESILQQIDRVVIDAHYRGINLLKGDDLHTDFNARGSSFLITEGKDFTADGLGLSKHNDFTNIDDVSDILEQIREAKTVVREFSTTLVNKLSVIETRDTFTRENINTLEAGADDLTVADLNKEGANELASLTRLGLGITALALAGQSQRSILQLVS